MRFTFDQCIPYFGHNVVSFLNQLGKIKRQKCSWIIMHLKKTKKTDRQVIKISVENSELENRNKTAALCYNTVDMLPEQTLRTILFPFYH